MPRKLDSDSQIGRRLTLRDLHLFLTVVQHGSMASAAVQLGISQPNVSEVIADLERALDARLFDRRPRGVEPTMYGEALLKRTRAVFDELRQGVKDIEFLADPARGEVRIGFPPAAMATFLPDLIQKFSDAYPKVVLRISEVPRSAINSVLRERTHDLHMEWCVPPFSRDNAANNVNIEYLFDDHFVIVAGPNTRWARRRKIALEDLIDEPWILPPPESVIGSAISKAFRAAGLEPELELRAAARRYGGHVRAWERSLAEQAEQSGEVLQSQSSGPVVTLKTWRILCTCYRRQVMIFEALFRPIIGLFSLSDLAMPSLYSDV
jgi:DNA-binding transcriptional LysR family regulator